MRLKSKAFSSNAYRQRICIFLAICAVISFGIGHVLAGLAGDHYFRLLRVAASGYLSLDGLLLSVFLPYFIAMMLVSWRKPFMIYLICGLRCITVSACGYGIFRSFEYGGWLISFLMQFFDYCLLPVFLWFSYRTLSGVRRKRDTAIYLAALILIGILNYMFISPFLVTLIDIYRKMEGYAVHVGFDWRL